MPRRERFTDPREGALTGSSPYCGDGPTLASSLGWIPRTAARTIEGVMAENRKVPAASTEAALVSFRKAA
jgi:hypothetical protein